MTVRAYTSCYLEVKATWHVREGKGDLFVWGCIRSKLHLTAAKLSCGFSGWT